MLCSQKKWMLLYVYVQPCLCQERREEKKILVLFVIVVMMLKISMYSIP